MTNIRICQVCTRSQAVVFCECTSPPTLLCENCFPTHPMKNPTIPHQVMPIAALGQNSQSYIQKFRALTQGAAELRSNVELFQKCKQDFSMTIQSAIDYLTQYRDNVLQQLEAEEKWTSTTIETAVREAESCLAGSLSPRSELGQALLTWTPSTLNLFTYVQRVPDFGSLCQTWITWENRARCLPQSVYGASLYRDSPSSSSPETFYGYCAFCSTSFLQHTVRYQVRMKCGHTACKKQCYDNHTALGERCPLCLSRQYHSK